ncbi:hypothetical protein ACX1C1_16995 [Paenibacillus sp. strain BS8-2]
MKGLKKTVVFVNLLMCCIWLVSCSYESEKSEGSSISPTFMFENKEMIGTKKMSIIYDSFITDNPKIYVFHLGGGEEELGGEKSFTLVAEHLESGDSVVLEENVALAREVTGINTETVSANYYIATPLDLPKEGMWKLRAYINEELWESITVELYKP